MELTGLPEPAAVVFDLDGTLVATVDARIDAWLAALDEIGIQPDRQAVAVRIGADGKRLAREIAQAAGVELNADDLERIDARSGELYDELNVDPAPIDGARSLLLALDGLGVEWAIATSSRAEQVGPSVAALGLPEPPTIVDGSHVEHAKPAPDLLLLAAERLDAPKERCWYVGDSTWDMQAANAAGMVAVGVPYGAVDADALRDAGAAVVTTLAELEAELRRRSATPGPAETA